MSTEHDTDKAALCARRERIATEMLAAIVAYHGHFSTVQSMVAGARLAVRYADALIAALESNDAH